MKLKFNSNLDYQLDAIKSVTDIFEGLPIQNESFGIDFGRESGTFFNELGFCNTLSISDEQILKNLQSIQSLNNVPKSLNLI